MVVQDIFLILEMDGKMANNVWKWTKLSAVFTIIISTSLYLWKFHRKPVAPPSFILAERACAKPTIKSWLIASYPVSLCGEPGSS